MWFEYNVPYVLFKTLSAAIFTLAMISTLTDYKYKKKKVLMIYGVYLSFVSVTSYFIIQLESWHTFFSLFAFVVFLPSVLLTIFLVKDEPFQVLFNCITQINISIYLLITENLITTLINGDELLDYIIQLFLYVITIWLEYHYFRKPFRDLINTIRKSWGSLSLIPICFCLITIFCGLHPPYNINNQWSIMRLYCIILTMIIVYFVIFHSLYTQISCIYYEKVQTLLKSQVTAMEKQSESILHSEESIDILRHDLRHYIRTILSEMHEGHTSQVVQILTKLEDTLNEITVEMYCDNLTLNAAISPFIATAKENGIETEVHISIPEKLNISNIEFAVCISNALENAIEACLSNNKSSFLHFLCNYRNGQLAVEISNSCYSPVIFNHEHFPISSKGKSHGVGIQSISAFAQKYNAFLDFECKDNIFTLRLLLDDEAPLAAQTQKHYKFRKTH